MRERKTPRQIDEDQFNIFSIELDRGVHHFRTPFPLTTARLLRQLQSMGLDELVKVNREDPRDPSILHTVEDMFVLGGAAIGFCWHNRGLDLETKKRDFGHDLMEYGEAVLEELYDYGYEMKELQALYPPLFAKLSGSLLTRKEIDDQKVFTEAAEGKHSKPAPH